MATTRTILSTLVVGLSIATVGCGRAKYESGASILVPKATGTAAGSTDVQAVNPESSSDGGVRNPNASAATENTPNDFERIEALVAECNDRNRAELEQIEKDAEAAESQEEINRLVERAHALQGQARKQNAPLLKEILTLATPYAAEVQTVDPLIWLLTQTLDAAIVDPTVALLMAHHTTDRRTLDLALRMKNSGYDWVERLLRAQVASPDLSDDRRPEMVLALATALQRTRNGETTDPAKIDEAIGLLKDLHQSATEDTDHRGRRYVDLAERSLYEIEHLSVGKIAPDIEGEDLDGVTFKLSDSRGKVVMLNFWATWCGPCMALIPHERELVAKYADRPFALIGVNGDVNREMIRPVLAVEKITWRSFWTGERGPAGAIPADWNVTAWPTVFLIDHQGVIRARQMNDELLEELVKAAEAELAQPKP